MAVLALTLAQSLFWADNVPLVLKFGIATVGVLAYLRPPEALLVVAGIAPLSRMFGTRIWPEAYPARITEALVLTFLAGWLIRSLRNRSLCDDAAPTIKTPALLFGATVGTSCLVHIAVLQVWKDYPWEFAKYFSHYLATGYLTNTYP